MSRKAKYKAIVHVDGDAFFAYCEVAQNERLRGKPVVTGQEKGMAIAVSYEAKARGVSRGMLMGEIKKLVPDVIILPGNYELYKIMCRRMYKIVGRYAARVEEYSIDECFADISLESDNWDELVEIARNIKHDLEHDLGMTFSLGLGPTKTLAKVASKWKKPAGFTAIQKEDIEAFLKDVPIGAVWGIGRSMSAQLQKFNVTTALEFIHKPYEWVSEHFAKPVQEIWYELQGIQMHKVGQGNVEKHKSIRATRTFRPPTRDKDFLISQLAKNAENACSKLRHHDLQAKNIYLFLKTQTFRYYGQEIKFDIPVTTPSEIMNEVKRLFSQMYRSDQEYRATGIVLNTISPGSIDQPDLFGNKKEIQKRSYLYKTLDDLYDKFGRNAVFIASSLSARLRNKVKQTKQETIYETCLRLGFPYWGEAA